MALVLSSAESRLTVSAIQANEATDSATPKISAFRGDTVWRTSGRRRVRRMMSSMSRSTYWLMAFAPPAASVPPKTVASISQGEGMPRWARTMVGTVVTSSSSMIRGLVSAMYARSVSPRPSPRPSTDSRSGPSPAASMRRR